MYFKNKYIALGMIGALMILYGHFQDLPQIFYIIGSLALLATAINYKLLYFIALEIILVAGHTAILLGVGRYTQIALPVLLCFQLLIFYIMVGKENSVFLLIGVIGIAFLSLGLSYNDQWIFFVGGFSIAIYAYYIGYKGCYPAIIWAVLNTIFSLLALYKLIF
jgi:hypothetical protein